MAAGGAGVSGSTSFVLAALLFLGIAAAVWFLIPNPDAKHRFVAPSGDKSLELSEACREHGCERAIILDVNSPDVSHRRRCKVGIDEQRPVWPNAYPLWSADEQFVEIVYADAQGIGGKLAIDLDRDCAATQ